MSTALSAFQIWETPLFTSLISPRVQAMHDAPATEPFTREDSDNALMRAVQAADDARAFTLLVQRYETPIRRMMLVMVKHAETAQDLTQDTFTKVWAKRLSFDPAQSLRPWLFAIARNVARSHLRWSWVRRFTTHDTATLATPTPEPLRVREELERHQEMHEALATLSVADREIIALRFAESMAFKEVGVVLGIREASARVRAHRALERLKKELANRGVQR